MDKEDKIFDLMERMYNEMQNGFNSVNTRIDNLGTEIKKTNIVVEQDIKPKIEALFDGYTLLDEKVDRIEQQVTKQEEFIIKRVK